MSDLIVYEKDKAIDPEIVDEIPYEEQNDQQEFQTPSPFEVASAYEHAMIYGCPVDNAGPVNALGCAFWMSLVFVDIVYIGTEKKLYRRCLKTGCFREVGVDEFRTKLLELLALTCENVLGFNVGHKCTPGKGREIMEFFLDFVRNDQFFNNAGKIILHLRNCFLVWEHETFVSYPLSTEWIHSRKMLNASFNPNAKPARRFRAELLEPVLSVDEIELLLLYAAQCLLGKNVSQTILIIVGEAGTGKSVTVNLIEALLGEANVTQLRTECLGGHFETQRYIGRSLLTGKDVPPDFLRQKGASTIKALTGNDRLATETKHSSEVHEIIGDFCVIITSNSSQPIAINSDRGAWERRVRTIQFMPHKPEKPITDFEKVLLAEEGEGIFLEILQHLEILLKNGGHIHPSQEQQRAIANLLDESESPEAFLNDRVEAVVPEAGKSLRKCKVNLTSEELYLGYKAYCMDRGWVPIPARKFQDQLVDLMPKKFERFRVYDIIREGTKHRGYYAVQFR